MSRGLVKFSALLLVSLPAFAQAPSDGIRLRLSTELGLAMAASGQSATSAIAPEGSEPSQIRRGERLSDWLLRQPADAANFRAGLSWRVPAEQLPQARLKQRLLAELAVSPSIKVPVDVRERLARWLQALPVTGRVPIALADPRWLQSHPQNDPLLDVGQTVVLPSLPKTVTVITADGRRCQPEHLPGSQARSYLRACLPEQFERIDSAWIVQPDGRVFRYGIAPWNQEAQDEPAPGAWIWAPPRDAGWPALVSEEFARFLATQGPAADTLDTLEALEKSRPIAFAVRPDPPARDAMISASDWGEIGLLQTPTARMAETGDISFNFSRVYPYGRGNIMFQPLDWLEAGFRYTNISNILYGPVAFSGNQALKDKSLDFKLRLATETAQSPAIALGIIDIGGTGLFSSEYLVANKRSGNLDLSLGIAWGYLGSRGNLKNPLSLLSSAYEQRPGSTSTNGGTFNTKSFFRGRTALIGGLQYQTPWEGVVAKVELDGNNYQHEPSSNNQKAASPLNFGLNYRYSPSIDIGVGLERGNTVMLNLNFHGALNKVVMPKLLDPAPVPVTAARPAVAVDGTANGAEPWSRTADDLTAQTQWRVLRITQAGSDLRVLIENAEGTYWQDRLDRAAAVLNRDAPPAISRFVLVFQQHGLRISENVILRNEWVKDHSEYRPPTERIPAVAALAPRPVPTGSELWNTDRAPYHFGIVPSIMENIGGPDGFILYQIGVAGVGDIKLGQNTWISGKLNYRLLDNYSHFVNDGPSLLPHVRTYLREYMTTSTATLPNLQVTHVGQLGDNQFYSAYAGYLEMMFAGVGAEWLYRPWQSHVAFGVDVNHVQQRDFQQNFGLRDYRVNTGHATLYWDTGWNDTHVNFSVGQYLAGDRGATIDVSRTFRNGLTLGAFATKTNVSSAVFGEGSFDKGIYLSIPFDAFLPYSSPTTAHFLWSPLTRDGGARLMREQPLYALTSGRDRRALDFRPAESRTSSIEQGSDWLQEAAPSLFSDIGQSSATVGHQMLSGNFAGAVLKSGLLIGGAALFDKGVDRFALKHGTGVWKSLGTVATNIPFALAAGTGLLWWGVGDDAASQTAWTGIKAMGLTLVGEEGLKVLVGRARPIANLGSHSFSPGSTRSSNASFPSVHMGVAFAAVTPFAEKYDVPWLYWLAGATAYGRIEQRQHFLSDTVAGGLIGYAVGSMLSDEQSRRKNPTFGVGIDKTVKAQWQF